MTGRKRSAAARPGGPGEEGLALVLALLFIVLLTAIVVDFTYEMQVEASFAEVHILDLEAYMAAKSAIASGLGLLAADLLISEEDASFQNSEVIDSLEDIWAEGVPMAPMNRAIMQCKIQDEYGKLNLNALVIYPPETRAGGGGGGAGGGGQELEVVDEVLREALYTLFSVREPEEGSPEEMVDSIIDWLDFDDEPSLNGVETDYYSSLDPPYAAKNGPMDNIEELLLIPGITPEFYFGDPEKEQIPLNELLTVHGHPEGKLNINTAALEVLEAYFSADEQIPDPYNEALATLERLEVQGPYYTMQELEEEGKITPPADRRGGRVAGTGRANSNRGADRDGEDGEEGIVPFKPMLTLSSQVFRLYGDGESADAKVRIEAYVWRDTGKMTDQGIETSGSQQMFRIIDWRVIR